MLRNVLILFLLLLTNVVYAENDIKNLALEQINNLKSLNSIELLSKAKDLLSTGQYNEAETILSLKPYEILELEIERLNLLAKIALLKKDEETAIEIYRFILARKPNITSIRLKLAELYFVREEWIKADHHFRLALTDSNLTPNIKNNITTALFLIRKNKNWQAWFNFSLAPDNNINNATSGKQCIATPFGILCNQLNDPEKAIGFNYNFGINYEFKLKNNWSIKNELNLQRSVYDKSQYNDLSVSYNIGPRYTYKNGESFLAITTNRRYTDKGFYNYSIGAKLDTSYDITNKLNLGVSFLYTPTYYVSYPEILDSKNYSTNYQFNYSIDASKYLLFKTGYEKEVVNDDKYSNYKFNWSIGIGAYLFFGFNTYIEFAKNYIDYKKENYFIKNLQYKQIKEKDFINKYTLSVSNNKISLFGFLPTINLSVIDKHSNIWQKEYKKSTVTFTLNQKL